MQPIPLKSIVFYASNEPKYTGSVGIITSGFIFPTAEIKMQEVKFTFGTFWHEFTHLHLVKQFTDKQKQSLEKLKTTYPHLFMEHEMRIFSFGECVTHSDYLIDGTIKGARQDSGHYKVHMDDGMERNLHESKLTLKNNVTPLELAEKRVPTIVATIKTFLATDLAQQLSPAQQAQLNKPGNYTTWQPLTPALIKADLERQAMEFINATKEKQVTDAVPESPAQQPETVESNPQLRQEDSQATAETSDGAEVVTNPVINKDYVPVVFSVERDVKATLTVIEFNKQRWLDQIDKMPLEDITAGWIKSIKDSAVAFDKQLNAPIQAWRAEINEIIAHAEARVASIKAAKAKEEAVRKQTRTTRANELIKECKAKSNLPPEYLAKIVFKDEYTLVKNTDKKIIEDIELQIETQRALKKGADDAAALKVANIKNRELLIDNLNIKYSVEGKYSMFPIETFSDEQVLAKYEQNHQRKLELERIERERLDAEKIKNEAKAAAEHSTQVEQSTMLANSTTTMESVSAHKNQNNTTTAPETQTVVMFKLVVTGHTQARHDHSIPYFIEDIQAAVAVGLAEPIAKGWAYSFEVVK